MMSLRNATAIPNLLCDLYPRHEGRGYTAPFDKTRRSALLFFSVKFAMFYDIKRI